MTELHRAVWSGDADAVTRFIQEGADVNARDGGGYTPLHWAADKGSDDENRKAIARALIAAGADLAARDLDGDTPLATARLAEAQGIIDILLENGAA